MIAPARSIVEGDDPAKLWGELEVRVALMRACSDAGSPEAFARLHKMKEVYVVEAVKGRAFLSDKLVELLGFDKVTRYRRNTRHRQKDAS